METEYCERCQRVAPAVADPGYVDWEAVNCDDGTVGIICPGCLTGEDQGAIDDDAMELEAEVKRRRELGYGD